MIEVWIGIAAVLVAVLALLSFLAKSKEDKDPPDGNDAPAPRQVKRDENHRHFFVKMVLSH